MSPVLSPPRGLTDAAPFPPDCAARFQFTRRLASGGFGAVYLATQRTLERSVAIKLLLRDVLREQEQVDRFNAEAKITARIAHPNVIQVIDHGAEYGIPWIAYEYAPGRSVRDFLADGPGGLPLPLALGIAGQVAAALDAAHAAGVLHRDIKPDNVLEAADGWFKVTDFGIARWSGAGAVRTRTGLVLATPAYAAPELILARELSPATDVYALGVMLFELLTGQLPFTSENVHALVEQHLHAAPPRPSGRRPELPRALDAIVQRALEKSPESRFPSAGDLAAALAALQPDAAPPFVQTVRREPASRGSPRAAGNHAQHAAPAPPEPRPPGGGRRGLGIGLFLTGALALAVMSRPSAEPVNTVSPAASASPASGHAASRQVAGVLAEPGERERVRFVALAGRLNDFAIRVRRASVDRSGPAVLRRAEGEQIPWLPEAHDILDQAAELAEGGRRVRLAVEHQIVIGEAVDEVLGACATESVMPREGDRLAKTMARLRRLANQRAQNDPADLLALTVRTHLVHVLNAGAHDHKVALPDLVSAEQTLAAVPSPKAAILEGRIWLALSRCTFIKKSGETVAAELLSANSTARLAGTQREHRSRALVLARALVQALAAEVLPAEIRRRCLNRALQAAWDHALTYPGDAGELRAALELARDACPLVRASPRSREDAVEPFALFASLAHQLHRPAPCPGQPILR